MKITDRTLYSYRETATCESALTVDDQKVYVLE